MPQIGTWTTAEGTSEARLELASEDIGINTAELPGWASDALKGAVAGAATGAAGGPFGALVGAATGGIIGAASSAGSPAPAASSAAASVPKQPTDASRAKAIQALQQFAAVVPALIQLLSASSQGRKESLLGEGGDSREGVDASDWGPESFKGTWTIP
jgi:phage tail tape-measure protein